MSPLHIKSVSTSTASSDKSVLPIPSSPHIASSKIISWISRKTPGSSISYSRRNLIVHINRVAQEPDQNVLPNDLVLGIDNDEEGNEGPVNIAPNDNEIAVAPADNNDPGPGAVNVIHLTEGYVLRVMVSTLLSPFISPACGAVLKSISKHSSVLRTVLGIDAARGIGKLGIRSRLVAHGATLGFLAPVSLQYDVGIEDMDPVWYVNYPLQTPQKTFNLTGASMKGGVTRLVCRFSFSSQMLLRCFISGLRCASGAPELL